jgi:hypothetical protein
MFLTATKVAIVESLRAVWWTDGNIGQQTHDYNPELDDNDRPLPRRITIEYPEEPHDWPFILVQVHPRVIEWTGVMPDEIVDAAEGSDQPAFKLIRQGRFEASCVLQIMALTSGERDKMWDNLVKLLLMGRKRDATRNFFTTLEEHDLVGITIIEGTVEPVGDTVSMGTPWDPELISYEASIQFDMVGVFYADEYNEDLVPLTEAAVYEYISFEGNTEPNESPPGENDGKGEWADPWE